MAGTHCSTFSVFFCLFIFFNGQMYLCHTEIDGGSATSSILLKSKPFDGVLCGWWQTKKILNIRTALTWKSRQMAEASVAVLVQQGAVWEGYTRRTGSLGWTGREVEPDMQWTPRWRRLAGMPEGGQTMQQRSCDALPTVNTEASQTWLRTACILGRLISLSSSRQGVGAARRCNA